MVARLPNLAITVGEPAGIGPEISIKAAWRARSIARPILIGDARFLIALAQRIDPNMLMHVVPIDDAYQDGITDVIGSIAVLDCPLAAAVVPGKLDAKNSLSVLQTLDLAVDGVGRAWFDAIVTAPLHKSIINDAGVNFSGHTEYLADKTNTPRVVMMLAGVLSQTGAMLRVALATTHLALRDVPDAITHDGLVDILKIIDTDLKNKFGITKPHIVVTGLNPHAGENGYLGREEIDVISPAIQTAQSLGMQVSGPYSADTLFLSANLVGVDCVLVMYHDQGLPVLKFATFGQGVNITLGLPLIRTSVDHGTALNLASKGIGYADCASMDAAINIAVQMALCNH